MLPFWEDEEKHGGTVCCHSRKMRKNIMNEKTMPIYSFLKASQSDIVSTLEHMKK